MPCYHPVTAYYSKKVNASGKRSLVFDKFRSYDGTPIKISCGQCVGCRLERSRQWAVRCVHEASLHDDNCFITLTYSPEHLPEYGSLALPDFQKFMKRLRKKFGKNIRFFHCGEYGDTYGRPHYHACLFNVDFPDKKLWKEVNGNRLYTSEILNKLWPYGHSSIGEVTFESAAYVARYIMKKITGKAAKAHYERFDLETGEVVNITPEYTTMSRRPGIGKGWIDKYKSDVYPHDFVVMNKAKMRPPRYYDDQYDAVAPFTMELVKEKRVDDMEKYVDNNTEERLNVRERVQEARLEKLKRTVDKEI
jgi:hypothetical protein